VPIKKKDKAKGGGDQKKELKGRKKKRKDGGLYKRKLKGGKPDSHGEIRQGGHNGNRKWQQKGHKERGIWKEKREIKTQTRLTKRGAFLRKGRGRSRIRGKKRRGVKDLPHPRLPWKEPRDPKDKERLSGKKRPA